MHLPHQHKVLNPCSTADHAVDGAKLTPHTQPWKATLPRQRSMASERERRHLVHLAKLLHLAPNVPAVQVRTKRSEPPRPPRPSRGIHWGAKNGPDPPVVTLPRLGLSQGLLQTLQPVALQQRPHLPGRSSVRSRDTEGWTVHSALRWKRCGTRRAGCSGIDGRSCRGIMWVKLPAVCNDIMSKESCFATANNNPL